ncbi:MAG: PIG-L family deacetylase, partial [Longimicrobiales bacterium]
MKTPLLAAAVALMLQPIGTAAQATSPDEGLVGTALKMRQLDGVKRVLMIGAHPDDEDTSLLTALARGNGAETAYLSLSRGEGGQNLIGPQLHEGLGIIRTGELVSARRLDGGGQYFTRAFDFGYSKNIDEALGHWPKEEVLRDVVYVVRSFRPHVIVSVFSGTERDGHGQHQIAGVTALEAFDAAGDPARFPELTSMGVEPWSPFKLYRSARFSPNDATARIPTGTFDPILGRSYFQVAMESRSQHRSQDMGVSQFMGPRQSALQLLDSRGLQSGEADAALEDGVFAGIDTTFFGQLPDPLPSGWPADTRAQLERYSHAIRDAEASLSALDPTRATPNLLEAHSLLESLAGSAGPGAAHDLLVHRMEQLSEIVLSSSGLVTDVRVSREILTPGESAVVDVNVWNGGPFAVANVLAELALPEGWTATPTDESAAGPPRSPFFRPTIPETPTDASVAPGSIARWSWRVEVPASASVSEPYFLEHDRSGDLYEWPDDPTKWALPFDPSPVAASVSLDVARPDGSSGRVEVARSGEYVGVDKAVGEYREPPLIVPALSLDVEPKQMVWPQAVTTSRAVTVIVSNSSATERSGAVRLSVPTDFIVEPATQLFTLGPNGASRSFVFEVIPRGPLASGEHVLRAIAVDDAGAEFTLGHEIIDYPHIRRTALFDPAQVTVSAFPVVANTDLRVGYIMGSGDDGPRGLAQMGMQVDVLGEDVVREGDFGAYDVLVLGVRAYETRPDLVDANDDVLAFARTGGTVIVQYNKYEYPAGGFAPYDVEINRPHDRVTDETASV